MTITRLRITIEPWHLSGHMNELRVEVVADGEIFNAMVPVRDDDFTSRFDILLDQARREIHHLIKTRKTKAA